MQWSLNKDHQHHKWQQQKSWISYQDCQGAQDKQLMQYLLTPRWKWKMRRRCWKFQNRNVQTFGFVYHDTNGLNHGPVWKIQSFLLNGICAVILWQDCYGKGNLRKFYWNTVGRRFPNWEYLFVHREKGLLLPVYVDDIKLGKDIVDNYKNMFESGISAGAVEKLPTEPSGKPDANTISSWSYDMEGHAKKCVERYCEVGNKTTQQLHKVATPCLDDHHFKEEEIGSVGELSTVSSQIEMLVFGSYWWTWCFNGPWTNLLVRSQNGLKFLTNV